MRLSKSIYGRDSLLKAAYAFTDTSYIHLDQNESEWIVSIESKNGDTNNSEKEFENEIIAQELRHRLLVEKEDLRKIILARAMASTAIIDDCDDGGDIAEESSKKQENVDNILHSWFENENNI